MPDGMDEMMGLMIDMPIKVVSGAADLLMQALQALMGMTKGTGGVGEKAREGRLAAGAKWLANKLPGVGEKGRVAVGKLQDIDGKTQVLRVEREDLKDLQRALKRRAVTFSVVQNADGTVGVLFKAKDYDLMAEALIDVMPEFGIDQKQIEELCQPSPQDELQQSMGRLVGQASKENPLTPVDGFAPATTTAAPATTTTPDGPAETSPMADGSVEAPAPVEHLEPVEGFAEGDEQNARFTFKTVEWDPSGDLAKNWLNKRGVQFATEQQDGAVRFEVPSAHAEAAREVIDTLDEKIENFDKIGRTDGVWKLTDSNTVGEDKTFTYSAEHGAFDLTATTEGRWTVACAGEPLAEGQAPQGGLNAAMVKAAATANTIRDEKKLVKGVDLGKGLGAPSSDRAQGSPSLAQKPEKSVALNGRDAVVRAAERNAEQPKVDSPKHTKGISQ